MPTPSVTLAGPDVVDAGSINRYTVTVTGGPAQTAGTNVSAGDEAGILAPVGNDLRVDNGELVHSQPKPFAGGNPSVSFSFTWTAPDSDGTVALYAAGNSTNGSRNTAGDGIGSSVFEVTVQNGTDPTDPTDPPNEPPATSITLQTVAEGFASPVALANAGDSRLFVVERGGKIKIVEADGRTLATPFLDIGDRVLAEQPEQGLLGLAFHPEYTVNGFFYLYYTRANGAQPMRSRVARYSLGDNPNVVDPASEIVILEFEQPNDNHNAGDLHFGPEGWLYISSGDGGNGPDVLPTNISQDSRSLLGKLLRIDVDSQSAGVPDCDIAGGGAYGIPHANAYSDGPGGQGCDEIYASGLRNPWRFSIDRVNRALWIPDVGGGVSEEINRLPAGSVAGANFGWRCREGSEPFDFGGQPQSPDHAVCANAEFREPLTTYPHEGGNCAITGGVVYRGERHPDLYGRYLFADFCSAWIRSLPADGSGIEPTEHFAAGQIRLPVAFGEDAAGEVYLATLDPGTVYRLVGSDIRLFQSGFE